MPAALTGHHDARQLVRLIQCSQCSRPFRLPVTLPCGNSLCRECLPRPHQREHISYPDLPGRREGFCCPFCEQEHPTSDCNVDVTLAKIMDAVADLIAKHQSVIASLSSLLQENLQNTVSHSDAEPLTPDDRKNTTPVVHKLPGSHLLATYELASVGKLQYGTELTYLQSAETDDSTNSALDAAFLQELVETTQKEVDCQICYNIMLDPVTTYCGHTLCRRCLARVLDHSQHCPVCRRALAIPPSLLQQPGNRALVDLLQSLCPEATAARAEVVTVEESAGDGQTSVPLFVCTLGFPNQPTFLRIFEPRYRLMLRRCLEGNGQFGILMYNRYGEPQADLGPVHFYQYGTMLHIVQAQIMPDGTSLIETRGLYRFRVRSHRVLDGYTVGDVERIDDVSLIEEERIEADETSTADVDDDVSITVQINQMSTQDLLALGHEFISRNQERSAIWLQQRVLDVHGQPPADAAVFPYWFASVVPINDEEKYKLLPVRTVRERLKITAAWIRRIESQRWYQSSACQIL